MDQQRQFNQTPVSIYIRIDQKKTCCLKASPSQTVAELRALLVEKGVQLPNNVQFIDAKGFPVLVSEEENTLIGELVKEDGEENIINLESKTHSEIGDAPRSHENRMRNVLILVTILCAGYFVYTNGYSVELIKKPFCSLFRDSESSKILRVVNCSSYQNTTTYLEKQIKDIPSGREVFVNQGNNIKKVNSESYIHESNLKMYNEWVANREQYKADYEWYNTMKSDTGACGGRFNERVTHSSKVIKDTSESIHRFTEKEFQSWPQRIKDKVDIENVSYGNENDDDDDFILDSSGKISSNTYLVTWRRADEGNVVIQTCIVIFEREAGQNCRFAENFWTGHKDRIQNARKYFLLTKLETNAVYRYYFLGAN